MTRHLLPVLALFASGVAATCAAAGKPNVVFFLVDDLGYMDIRAYNPDSFYETPHCDRIAAAVVCESAEVVVALEQTLAALGGGADTVAGVDADVDGGGGGVSSMACVTPSTRYGSHR